MLESKTRPKLEAFGQIPDLMMRILAIITASPLFYLNKGSLAHCHCYILKAGWDNAILSKFFSRISHLEDNGFCSVLALQLIHSFFLCLRLYEDETRCDTSYPR